MPDQKQYLQATNFMAEKQWSKAAAILEELVIDNTQPEIVYDLVRALYHDQQYVRGMNYLLQSPEIFYTTIERAQLAVNVLLKCHYFIRARIFVTTGPHSWQEQFCKLIDEQEQVAQSEYQETISEGLQKFYHLGDGNVYEQQERLTAAYRLPLATFITGTRFVLRDPFVHPLVRSNIIEILRELQIATRLTYYWLDQKEHQVVPRRLLPLSNIPVLEKVKKYLQERLANNNHMLYQAAIEQLNLQATFLFPRVSAVIKDPNEWGKYLIGQLTGVSIKVAPETSKWQELLTSQIEKLARAKE